MTATTPDAATITRCSFARLVALHCRLSGHDPGPHDLDIWLAAVWPMVTEEMALMGRRKASPAPRSFACSKTRLVNRKSGE